MTGEQIKLQEVLMVWLPPFTAHPIKSYINKKLHRLRVILMGQWNYKYLSVPRNFFFLTRFYFLGKKGFQQVFTISQLKPMQLRTFISACVLQT